MFLLWVFRDYHHVARINYSNVLFITSNHFSPQVKGILTTKRVSVVVISVYVIMVSTSTPVYVVTRLGNRFYPDKNKTLIGLMYSESRASVEKASYIVNNILIPFSAFLIIIFGTVTLVVSLQKKAKWRSKAGGSFQVDKVSHRNHRVSKMVLIISAIFIACFFPFGLIFVAMSVEPELSITGRHKHVLIIVGGLGLVLESINSAGNIFIYFKMSSNYRDTFRQIFWTRN